MTARSWRRWLKRAPLFVVLSLLATACAKDAPQDALDPAGPIARQADNLFRPVFWIAVVIFVLVEGLVILVAVKFRQRREDQPEPAQIHGNNRLEFAWTLAPALLLLGIAIPTVITIQDLAAPPADDALMVEVTGKQWWWQYEYLDEKIITANELVIPVDREVFLNLESADVIHSFWVPRLAGKQDVVPGRTNTMRLIAEEPNQTYLGQCAEFCAISHANMRLRVRTLTAADFERWVAEQKAPAAESADGSLEARGRELFMANACIQCHSTDVGVASLGPNLAHLADRGTFAGSIFELDEENLLKWVQDAPSQKPMSPPTIDPSAPTTLINPGNKGMPSFLNILSEDEVRAIVAYLLSLK